ncbi:MAG: hypothetical protein JXB47_13910 [Anaerolineae bacterium]|nr:hypothetical protein [Anaerolineae bacterium]
MKARFVKFGQIEIDGERYEEDVIIDRGKVKRRKKKASKPYRDRFGHTPLSSGENIPWKCKRLIIGTGAYGSLPVMDEVHEEAGARGVELVICETPQACELLSQAGEDTNAVLHITC